MDKTLMAAALLVFGVSAAIYGQSFQLTDTQLEKLTTLIRTNADAGAAFARLRKDADGALAAEPNPVAAIRSEGLLNKDPLKIASDKSLKDMQKIYALGASWIILKDDRYLAQAKKYLLAWAGENESRGDPIDDTNLEGAIRGYDFAKQAFSAEERHAVDSWLFQVADKEIEIHESHPERTSAYNNWNSHRIKIIGLIAFVTGNKKYTEYTLRDYKLQIAKDLRPDGSSFDFQERDALHYHLYTLEPLLSLCIAARQRGYSLFEYESPEGNSLQKSVAFTMPFATGETVHREYVNSKVQFDRDRANAGQSDYASGRLFEPQEALLMLNEYFFFDNSILPLIQKIAKSKSAYPSWLVLLQSVQDGN